MIDHVTIQVSNVAKSKIFYEKAFKALSYKLSFGEDDIFYAFDLGDNYLFEIAQYKGETTITSSHIAFRVNSIEEVNEFYEAALQAGAKDNGKPGLRPEYADNYYACFVYDPDGHNIEAVFYT